MRRSRPALVAALSMIALAAVAAPRATSEAMGASALDALGFLRDAEARSYRLDEDGVRALAMRVTSPTIDDLCAPGAELAGRKVVVTLWWRAGVSSVAIEGVDGAPPDVVAGLQGLVQPLPSLLLPGRATRGLVGHAFRFVDGGTLLRQGDRGVRASARDAKASVTVALFAVNREGLVVGEHLDRADGRATEFRHEWLLQGGRYLLGATEGWIPGRHVAAAITWGALVGGRPMPTHVSVLEGDLMAPWPDSAARFDFELSEHLVNVEPPAGVFR